MHGGRSLRDRRLLRGAESQSERCSAVAVAVRARKSAIGDLPRIADDPMNPVQVLANLMLKLPDSSGTVTA